MSKKPRSLLDEAAELPNAAQLKAQRDAERQIANLKAQLDSERRKRQQAEAEVLIADQRADLAEVLRDAPGVPTAYAKPMKSRGPATAIICMNDWHVEEKVDPRTINGLNEYNLTIAAARIKKAFQNSIKLLDSERSISKIRDAKLWLGGDLITGYIHEELAEENYLSPTEAVLFAQEKALDGIQTLLDHGGLDHLEVLCSWGNHGRTTRKPRTSTAYKTSYEWLMYQFLAKMFAKNPRVRFTIATSYHTYVDVQGKTVRLHHGDKLKYQGGVGGLTIPVEKAIAAWNKSRQADLDIFGHWHQALFAPRWICCNCIIGTSSYGLNDVKAPHAPPSQTLIVVAANHPRWVTAKEIFCS